MKSNNPKNRKGQEEMVGFALIIIFVSVIILVFLGFSLNKNRQSLESYEAESFIISSLQYSTECKDYYGYVSLNDLIFMCNSDTKCRDGSDSCNILNSTLNGLLNQSWRVTENSPVKGYELNIVSNTGGVIPEIMVGNKTRNSQGTLQTFSKGGASVNITFSVFN